MMLEIPDQQEGICDVSIGILGHSMQEWIAQATVMFSLSFLDHIFHVLLELSFYHSTMKQAEEGFSVDQRADKSALELY